jgi:hypothetical protein
MDPGMREFLRNFGIEAPPAPPAAPKQPRKKVVKEKPKKEPVNVAPLFAEMQDNEVLKQAEQAGDPGKTVQAESRSPLPAGLSPLQQGFVWAEILGPAKAVDGLR